MALHMDGSRLWNAAAALGVHFREFTTDAGVDILSLGGTKNGLLGAEAIVVLDPERVDGIVFLRKTTMQLGSKMRFMSAQLLALFENDLGLRSAGHANDMAARLRSALEGVPGLSFTQATQANAVFAALPNDAADHIREHFRFYDWDRAAGEVRWMTAFDTTEADIDAFVAIIRAELAG
jgi:threonine aldolase